VVDIEVDENVATEIADVHENCLFIGGETLNIVAPTRKGFLLKIKFRITPCSN